jgi:hypothetical protein
MEMIKDLSTTLGLVVSRAKMSTCKDVYMPMSVALYPIPRSNAVNTYSISFTYAIYWICEILAWLFCGLK